MSADSGGGYNNGSDDSQRSASQDLRRATSLLRLLKSSSEESLDDPQLRQEFERLHELLERIDRIASEVESDVPASEEHVPSQTSTRSTTTAERTDDRERPEAQETPASTPETKRPTSDEPTRTSGTTGQSTPSHGSAPDEHSVRWWVHFNGDLSLDRLAKLRTHLDESPFTVTTRFDEITDGLIVLRIVTDERISMDHLDWILRQLMERVGLDPKSAIISKQ